MGHYQDFHTWVCGVCQSIYILLSVIPLSGICHDPLPTAVSSPFLPIYSYDRIKEMEVILLSKKVILDLVLLVLTAGLIVAKAAYESDWPEKIEDLAG